MGGAGWAGRDVGRRAGVSCGVFGRLLRHPFPGIGRGREHESAVQASMVSDRGGHEFRGHDLLRVRDAAERLRRDAGRVRRGPIPGGVCLRTVRGALIEDLVRLFGEASIIYLFPGVASSPIDGKHSLQLDVAQRREFNERVMDYSGRGYRLFGISSQPPEVLQAATDGQELNHDLLSDAPFVLADTLRLPTFAVGDSERAYHRLAVIVRDGEIRAAFPAQYPQQVDAWLRTHP
jgi:peroxiredoxin